MTPVGVEFHQARGCTGAGLLNRLPGRPALVPAARQNPDRQESTHSVSFMGGLSIFSEGLLSPEYFLLYWIY